MLLNIIYILLLVTKNSQYINSQTVINLTKEGCFKLAKQLVSLKYPLLLKLCKTEFKDKSQELMELTGFLLTKQININVKNKGPLYYAITHKNHELCQLLISKGSDIHPVYLHQDIMSLDINIVKLLVLKGCDVNYRDIEIHIEVVIKNCSFSITKFLISVGADIKKPDSKGKSLICSTLNKYPLLVLLLEAGADPQIHEYNYYTSELKLLNEILTSYGYIRKEKDIK